jgi:aryl-alcohol dehydrogenase-like predicted oxidoreductase
MSPATMTRTKPTAPKLAPTTNPLPQRVLGKTGESVPILGLGTAPAGMGLPDEEAIRLYHTAIDLGITYLDTAPGYKRAQVQLGSVMKERRDEVFLVTKTHTASAEKALDILSQSLKDLQTDHVDATFVHSMGSLDPEEVLSPEGALAGLREARRRGWTRFIGLTAHNAPARSARVLVEAEVDAGMFAMNFVDRHTYGFEEKVAPLAARQHAGLAAMKVFGGAPDMKYETPTPSLLHREGGVDHGLALRYALDLPGVAVAVVGMYTEDELRENIAHARAFRPLTEAERKILDGAGRRIARRWQSHFGEA